MNHQPKPPLLGITMGDVSGVGPEIIVRAIAEEPVHEWCRPLILGDPGAVRQAVDILRADLEVNILAPGSEPSGRPRTLDLLPVSSLSAEELIPGRPTRGGAQAAVRFIETGAEMALKGRIHGLVTAPVHKKSINQAGIKFIGHTELLAHKAGVSRVVMMLAGPRLRVVLVTVHTSLRSVPGLIRSEDIVAVSEIAYGSLARFFGLRSPRLAVAALNPHAGEEGLFGREEQEIIAPAVAVAKSCGLNIAGPFPADTLFHRAVSGEFDAVVCMYHDQGLIPIKLIHFGEAVNVTLGLPFIRTSVDHGTAYDLAGTGKADHGSLIAAIKMAADMAGRRRAAA